MDRNYSKNTLEDKFAEMESKLNRQNDSVRELQILAQYAHAMNHVHAHDNG